MSSKAVSFVVLLVCVSLLGVGLWLIFSGKEAQVTPTVVAPTCRPTDAECVVPEEWLKDRAAAVELSKQLNDERTAFATTVKERDDRLNGMVARLNRTVPQTHFFDEAKQKWVLRPTPPMPTASPAAR